MFFKSEIYNNHHTPENNPYLPHYLASYLLTAPLYYISFNSRTDQVYITDAHVAKY